MDQKDKKIIQQYREKYPVSTPSGMRKVDSMTVEQMKQQLYENQQPLPAKEEQILNKALEKSMKDKPSKPYRE